jgi:O-antigen/teichoic acid export membrane protein
MSVGLAARWVAASYVVGMLAFLAVNASAARLVGDDFGYFITCVTVSTALGQLGLMGVHRGGLREAARLSQGDSKGLAELRRDVRVATRVLLPILAVLTFAVTLALVDNRGLGTRCAISGAMGLLVWLGGQQKLWASYLRGFGDVRLASLMEGLLGGTLVTCSQGVVMGVLVLAAPHWGLGAALIAMAAAYAVPVLLASRRVTRVWQLVDVPMVTLSSVKAVVARHWRFASNLLSGYLNGVTEIWIAALVLSSVDTSMFAAAQRLSAVLAVPLGGLAVVLSPVIARLAGQDDGRLEKLLRTGATLGGLVTAAGWIPMLLMPGTLLVAIYGPGFRDASPILVALTLGSVSSVVAGLCGIALTMSRHEGVVARVMWAALAVRVPLGLGAAAAFGAVGLAVTASAVTAFMYAALWRLARHRMGVSTQPTLKPDWGLLARTEG